MTFSGKLLGKCIPHNHVREWPKIQYFYNQPKPNIQPWKHSSIANCWKSSDFWLLYKLINLIKWILIFKNFSYHPQDCWFFKCKNLLRPNFWLIVQSIILIGKQQWVWVSLCVVSVLGWLIVYQLGIQSLSCSQYSQTICWRRWDDNACLGARNTCSHG